MKKIVIICVLFYFNTNAQQKKDTTKVLTPIAITAIRASENAPFTNTIITAKKIADNNTGVDLPILLNSLTNMVTTSDAGAGVGYTGLRLRGSDISRINVTVNGVPINGAEDQSVYFVNFEDIASSAQSIQVQRGVGSSTNGAGAFGGSININSIDLQNKQSIYVATDFSSYSTWRKTLKWQSGKINNKYNIGTRLSHTTSNGYIDRSKSALLSGQFTMAYTINATQQFTLNVMSGTEKTGQAWGGLLQDSLLTNRTYNYLGQKADGTFYNNQSDNYTQHYVQLFYDNAISKNTKLNVAAYYTKGKGYYEEWKTGEALSDYNIKIFDTNNTIVTNADLIRQLWLNNHLIGINTTMQINTKQAKFSIGLHANTYIGQHFGKVISINDRPNNYTWYNLNANKQDLSAYVKMEYQLNSSLYYYADAQVRKVMYHINGFRQNPSIIKNENYIFLNPKIGLHLKLKNEKYNIQSLYASFSIANKEPNRDDLGTTLTNAVLPEQLYNTELGYDFKSENVNIHANVYYMKYIAQLIQTGKINDIGAPLRINVPNSYRAGLELEAVAKLSSAILIEGNVAISANKIKTYTDYIYNYDSSYYETKLYNNTTIAYAPSTVVGGNVTIMPLAFVNNNNKNLKLIFASKYVGSQYLDNTNDNTKMIKAYSTFNVGIKGNVKIGNSKSIELHANMINALNTHYETNGYTYGYIGSGSISNYNYYYPQAGRQFNIGAQFLFE
jgi:iron complex outermembrane recepter protein